MFVIKEKKLRPPVVVTLLKLDGERKEPITYVNLLEFSLPRKKHNQSWMEEQRKLFTLLQPRMTPKLLLWVLTKKNMTVLKTSSHVPPVPQTDLHQW